MYRAGNFLNEYKNDDFGNLSLEFSWQIFTLIQTEKVYPWVIGNYDKLYKASE